MTVTTLHITPPSQHSSPPLHYLIRSIIRIVTSRSVGRVSHIEQHARSSLITITIIKIMAIVDDGIISSGTFSSDHSRMRERVMMIMNVRATTVHSSMS